ncbi:MAG: hypothetical protein NT126_07550 [Bacteroidetes bacterium]|nr:hypothetical protein [Bacteroidota bacterium]
MTFYLSQLALDGKIYINCGNSTQDIHVINYPDNLGMSCDLQQHSIHLPAIDAFTIANHPNYFLGAEGGSMCDTVLSVQNIKDHDSNFRLFPNPVVSDEVTFTYNVLNESALLILNNIEGQEVARFHLPQWSSVQHLKLPKLSGGVYLARLLGNHISANVKFNVE